MMIRLSYGIRVHRASVLLNFHHLARYGGKHNETVTLFGSSIRINETGILKRCLSFCI